MAHKYDAIIIGAGQAGFPLAGKLAGEKGWQTALIEANLLGGTCVNTGCTPTKTMVASARAAHLARRGGDFGVQTGPIEIDMHKVRERVRSRSATSREGLEDWLGSLESLDIIYGHAAFSGPKTVTVNGEELSADHIFINTGARARLAPIPGIEAVDAMTNEDILELAEVPQHLIVIGGSYIGLEFSQAMRRFGAAVTILEASPRLIGREDPDISEEVRSIMENEGITIYTEASDITLRKVGHTTVASFQVKGKALEVAGTHLLVATGRQPNTDKLGLDKAGIETDKRGYIKVDDRLQTSVEGVYALGDVNGEGAFTHTSYNDFEILDDILFGDDTRRLSDRITTYGLFIDPPLGRVGMTEAQARDAGHEVLVATKPMSHVGRALEKDETQGLMKFLVDAQTERILGAAILGTGGDEIIASITNVMYTGAPYTVIQNAVHIHPTVAELIPSTLGSLAPIESRQAVAD
jgi:pyruvate/2-oxoglutarate dehydrogenase complex dihydrolipoamide dehydrogenase (E3) component